MRASGGDLEEDAVCLAGRADYGGGVEHGFTQSNTFNTLCKYR